MPKIHDEQHIESLNKDRPVDSGPVTLAVALYAHARLPLQYSFRA